MKFIQSELTGYTGSHQFDANILREDCVFETMEFNQCLDATLSLPKGCTYTIYFEDLKYGGLTNIQTVQRP
jgi:hypothetical protein